MHNTFVCVRPCVRACMRAPSVYAVHVRCLLASDIDSVGEALVEVHVENHNELVVYSCPCDTQEVSEMQQVHGRVPTNPTAPCWTVRRISTTNPAASIGCVLRFSSHQSSSLLHNRHVLHVAWRPSWYGVPVAIKRSSYLWLLSSLVEVMSHGWLGL